MVLFLNYLPWLLFLAALVVIWQAKVRRSSTLILIAIVLVISELALIAVGNTYVPRRTVHVIPNPEFEVSNAQVQDKLRKPELDSKASAEKLKSLTDWKKERE